jgi:hypothetical protein
MPRNSAFEQGYTREGVQLPTESATENRQPLARTGGDGEKVR